LAPFATALLDAGHRNRRESLKGKGKKKEQSLDVAEDIDESPVRSRHYLVRTGCTSGKKRSMDHEEGEGSDREHTLTIYWPRQRAEEWDQGEKKRKSGKKKRRRWRRCSMCDVKKKNRSRSVGGEKGDPGLLCAGYSGKGEYTESSPSTSEDQRRRTSYPEAAREEKKKKRRGCSQLERKGRER